MSPARGTLKSNSVSTNSKKTKEKPASSEEKTEAKSSESSHPSEFVNHLQSQYALSKVEAEIPIRFRFAKEEIPPFSTALLSVKADMNWYKLRWEYCHLSLLKGFDELLCLSPLSNVNTYWSQIETVRKVLKQFRGRVLLADEVGLGKTIEAGMIWKEYLLRGIINRVLIITPVSLVGQ
ncbi:hypothetical protein WDW89_04690 [Deltaproteobacteria bacterium TL4]